MINENLGKLVQHARDKKPTNFKAVLTDEIDSRIDAKVTEIRDGLSKNMFKMHENCEGHPDGEEHTHEDGTVHTHEGGEKPHTHEDEEVEEGTLPPALQKAIDAKKKKGGDDEDKEKDEGTLPPALQKAIDAKKKDKGDDDEDEDDSPVGKKDENIKNFGDKKAKAFTDDDNPTDNKKKKDKTEDIRAAAKRILNKEGLFGPSKADIAKKDADKARAGRERDQKANSARLDRDAADRKRKSDKKKADTEKAKKAGAGRKAGGDRDREQGQSARTASGGQNPV